MSGSVSSRRASSVPRKLPTPVMRTRRGRTSALRLAGAAAAALGRQSLLDRVEPLGDGAQLGADLLQILVRGRAALLERLGDPLAKRLRPRAGAPHDLIDRLLSSLARHLRGPDSRLDRALDGLPHRVGHLLAWAPGHWGRSVAYRQTRADPPQARGRAGRARAPA